MKNPRLYPSFLIAAAMAVILITVARADDKETSTIKFSDTAKPGVLKVNVANGDIQIRGTDAAEVSVQTDLKPEAPTLRKDGLRVLTSSSSYSLTERNNVVILNYGLDSWAGGSGDFNITVPRNTTVVVSCSYGGDVKIADLTGNIDVRGLNGEVVLDNVAGAAVVETLNGEIKATVRELVDGKPLSFTSMNGEVTLLVPAEAKAKVRLRTQNGSILTDFDDKALVTKTESVRTSVRVRGHSAPRAVVVGDATDAEVKAAVHDAVAAGAEAIHQATNAIREATLAARNAAREAERQARAESGDDTPVAPVAPLPPLPPMTGGKIVTGTLNGGGDGAPEIRVATMNGDVTLRKLTK